MQWVYLHLVYIAQQFLWKLSFNSAENISKVFPGLLLPFPLCQEILHLF